MILDFLTLASIASMICFVLSFVWLFMPQRLLSIWGVSCNESGVLVSRRGAALFLGLGMILFLARHAEMSPARYAISVGFIIACLALAALGILELVRKRAGIGILSAVLVELLLAIAFYVQL